MLFVSVSYSFSFVSSPLHDMGMDLMLIDSRT